MEAGNPTNALGDQRPLGHSSAARSPDRFDFCPHRSAQSLFGEVEATVEDELGEILGVRKLLLQAFGKVELRPRYEYGSHRWFRKSFLGQEQPVDKNLFAMVFEVAFCERAEIDASESERNAPAF